MVSAPSGRFRLLRLSQIAIIASVAPAVFAQPADFNSIKQPTAPSFFWDYSRFPQVLGAYVTAVFDNKASKPVQDRVAAAMRLDTFQIEAMTTDATVNHESRWRPSLERRQKILPIAQRILSLPEKEIDVWNVSMMLAKDAYPDLDVAHYNREFEKVVEQVKQATPSGADPERRIRTINTVLYLKLGIAYDEDERDGERAVYNRYPFSILDRKRGNCVNLALLYLAVGQRLGYPLYPVSAPEHLFVRYVDPGLKLQNIDPSGRGRYSPDEEYIRRLEIPEHALKNGTYLRTMSYRELAGTMVTDHGGFYYGQYLKDDVLAIALMERGLDKDPKNAVHWTLLATRYQHWGAREWMPDVREIKFIRGLVFMKKGMRMGLGKPQSQDLKERKERKVGKTKPGV